MSNELVRLTPSNAKRLVGAPDNVSLEDARQVRALIRVNPGGALALIADRDNNQLSLWQSALLFDEVVGQVPDVEECRQLIDDHVSPGTQEELLAIRSDLPASAAHVVDRERLIGAILRDIGAGEDNTSARAIVFLSWSLKLLEREDWPEILRMEIEDLTVQDLILLGIAWEHGPLAEISPDVYELHGINAGEAEERLRDLLADGYGLDDFDVEQAQKALGATRKAATSDQVNNLAEAARRAAEAATSGDDL
jgi:hypothetical protein